MSDTANITSGTKITRDELRKLFGAGETIAVGDHELRVTGSGGHYVVLLDGENAHGDGAVNTTKRQAVDRAIAIRRTLLDDLNRAIADAHAEIDAGQALIDDAGAGVIDTEHDATIAAAAMPRDDGDEPPAAGPHDGCSEWADDTVVVPAYSLRAPNGDTIGTADTHEQAVELAETMRDAAKLAGESPAACTVTIIDEASGDVASTIGFLSATLTDEQRAALTPEQRAAQLPAEQLPPLPRDEPSNGQSVTEASKRRSEHSRIAAGRLRSRETAAQYAVAYDPAERFPESAETLGELRAAVEQLDAVIDESRGDAAERAAYDLVSKLVHTAWSAGVPTTAIGSIIGASGGSARGRAIAYAKANGADVPKGTRSRVERKPERPVSFAPRYSAALGLVYAAAIAGDASVDAEIADAFAAGVPTTAVARAAGMTPASVKSIASDKLGDKLPSEDERKARRAELPIPELSDDDE